MVRGQGLCVWILDTGSQILDRRPWASGFRSPVTGLVFKLITTYFNNYYKFQQENNVNLANLPITKLLQNVIIISKWEGKLLQSMKGIKSVNGKYCKVWKVLQSAESN